MALANVIDFSSASEDVTMQFADMQSRLNIRLEEERRILTMIENTDDIESLIRLEHRLGNVRMTIDGIRRQMTEVDHQASFSTITLNLFEISEDEEVIPYVETFGGRMARAFGSSLDVSLMLVEIMAVVFASIVLPLAIVALPIWGGFMVVRKVRNRNV
jgi:hypothetical protein